MGAPDIFKLFKIRGGVHPDDCKTLSADKPIVDLPMPQVLHIPLQQHIGAAAEPLVNRGDLVKKGQLLARSQGAISAPVHAPTSGRIMGVGGYPANHPSGLLVRTITLKPDDHNEWIDSLEPSSDPFLLTPEEISQKVTKAGIVGMGGATFPSAVKLKLRTRYDLHTLVINGAECEPYLTCDDLLMQEESSDVLDGVRLMAHALGVDKIIIAIENNKPLAQQAMARAANSFDTVQVVGLPTRYPMGSEKHLVQTLTGKETPARGLTADIGIVVHNVATALAVHNALRYGYPLIARVMTVSGGAIKEPLNVRVPLGTPLTNLIEFCGGFKEEPEKLISGGPMMGQPLASTRVPVVKGSNGLLALTAEEIKSQQEMPCIRCASCVQACPCGLIPLEMATNIRTGSLDASVNLGLLDCIACGSCSYVCPSHIPLVQYFNYAKGELASRQRSQHKQGETKRLAEARSERMEAIKKAKRAKMLQRKKEMAEKKKLEAQKKQDSEKKESEKSGVDA
ncbi:MAG: electron transport complex subunit RsxC [gamma proteobacterium symbiont of Bathyaustriella thionipta]|nr:electron transport complex subunit RsxC [gamma proteobacterium symbiont of Bathyaustriella thionipta]MCU7949490.1 electron transport complex subunit RsxC [gamma proteobacterium symbiont of Bathyaustriella thionipta]MCU7952427.1 electron transport complex subunit RsxC [gamma proteobacterium symbiont of Bathyaustriella thionipta]MCU7956076.1 electron transport complex subunit RsxC [gamma proteobacterium symbiont of Bathyaustriella thionipta]MCU7968370.1 electron transport complex subunit RsxC 